MVEGGADAVEEGDAEAEEDSELVRSIREMVREKMSSCLTDWQE